MSANEAQIKGLVEDWAAAVRATKACFDLKP